jgi:hypothetical protein
MCYLLVGLVNVFPVVAQCGCRVFMADIPLDSLQIDPTLEQICYFCGSKIMTLQFNLHISLEELREVILDGLPIVCGEELVCWGAAELFSYLFQ